MNGREREPGAPEIVVRTGTEWPRRDPHGGHGTAAPTPAAGNGTQPIDRKHVHTMALQVGWITSY